MHFCCTDNTKGASGSLALQLGGDGLQVLSAAHAIPVSEKLIRSNPQGGGDTGAQAASNRQRASGVLHRLRGGGEVSHLDILQINKQEGNNQTSVIATSAQVEWSAIGGLGSG